jgi:hypothetical protein
MNMTLVTDEKGNTIPAEVWVTHQDLHGRVYMHGVSEKPWEDWYDAPVTKTASNTRYVPATGFVPNITHYEEGDFSQMLLEDGPTVTGRPVVVEPLLRMEDREIVGFQWAGKVPPEGGKEAGAHSDDIAVDRFAVAMKAKLAKKRDEGRGGWDDPEASSVAALAYMLVDHLPKGDPVDIANFAMMLHQRHAPNSVLSEATDALTAPVREAWALAPARKFRIGDRVRKSRGSSWQGIVVGFYSTELTPVGYCVESEREPGSVQVYPEAALERMDER